MDDYVPTEQDLKDFEEFQVQRDQDEIRSGRTTRVPMYLVSKGDSVEKCTRSVVMDFIQCVASVFSDIKEQPLVNRLSILELLGYDKYELVSVIDPGLRKEDIDALFEGKEYPYLYTGLKSCLSNEAIDRVLDNLKFARDNRLIASSLFCEVGSVADKELMYSKQQRIAMCSDDSSGRPLYWLREYMLVKGNKLGIWEYEQGSNAKGIRVPTKKFVQMLCYLCQDIPTTLKYQFGINVTKYCGNVKGTVKFSIPIGQLPIIETYFNVRFGYKQLLERGTKCLVFSTPEKHINLFDCCSK